ncbi:LamG domain-containing protein [Scytonema sp. NUACC26]|uniref:LamG domain-containing protein n=1 Tax=Scytonema sp. NUACC26 TaxID=3140176 RepID=UPI0034DBB996
MFTFPIGLFQQLSNNNNFSTKLLLHFDGVNNSSTFADSANNLPVFISGNTIISTVQNKFGGSSGYFDGNSSYIYVDSNEFNFGTSDFTIEAFIYLEELGKFGHTIFSKLLNNQYSRYAFYIDYTDKINFIQQDDFGNTVFALTSLSTIVLQTWTHVAVSRSGNNFYLFVDGVLEVSNNNNIAISGTNGTFKIGALDPSNPPYDMYFHGYIDEFRVSSSAIYTNNFIPPTGAFDS